MDTGGIKRWEWEKQQAELGCQWALAVRRKNQGYCKPVKLCLLVQEVAGQRYCKARYKGLTTDTIASDFESELPSDVSDLSKLRSYFETRLKSLGYSLTQHLLEQ